MKKDDTKHIASRVLTRIEGSVQIVENVRKSAERMRASLAGTVLHSSLNIPDDIRRSIMATVDTLAPLDALLADIARVYRENQVLHKALQDKKLITYRTPIAAEEDTGAP